MRNKIIKKLLRYYFYHLFSYAHTDYNAYVGKKVTLYAYTEKYVGVVEHVMEVEICTKTEPLTGACVLKEKFCGLWLRLADKTIKSFRCESISRIEELNG